MRSEGKGTFAGCRAIAFTVVALLLLSTTPGHAVYSRAGAFACTGTWSGWPGSGSGSCTIAGPDVGIGLDEGSAPEFGLATLLTWNFTFDDPCVQGGLLAPLGFASGTFSGPIFPVSTHGLPVQHTVTGTMESIRVGTVVVLQVLSYSIDGNDWDSTTPVESALPGIGVGTWVPLNAAGATCDAPQDVSATLIGETVTPA
jgi:hypothetical protein